MGSAWSSSTASTASADVDPVIAGMVKTHIYGSGGCVKKFTRACDSDWAPRDMEACAKAVEAMRRCMHANAVIYEQLARSKAI